MTLEDESDVVVAETGTLPMDDSSKVKMRNSVKKRLDLEFIFLPLFIKNSNISGNIWEQTGKNYVTPQGVSLFSTFGNMS